MSEFVEQGIRFICTEQSGLSGCRFGKVEMCIRDRYVSLPTDVFDIVELRYNSLHGTSNEKIRGFKELRINAELKACLLYTSRCV